LKEAETLSPHRAVLNQATTAGPLLVHQYTAPSREAGSFFHPKQPSPMYRMRIRSNAGSQTSVDPGA
jgi:hypothetical protein